MKDLTEVGRLILMQVDHNRKWGFSDNITIKDIVAIIERRVTKEINGTKLLREINYTELDVDLAYLCGVFNVSGIDGLHKELGRLKAMGRDPHDIIDECNKLNAC